MHAILQFDLNSSRSVPHLIQRCNTQRSNLIFCTTPRVHVPSLSTPTQVRANNPSISAVAQARARTTLFQAEPRALVPMNWSSWVLLTSKVVFFPVTLLHFLVSKVCAFIAFTIVVGNAKRINHAQRLVLQEIHGGRKVQFRAEDGVRLEGMHFQNSNASSTAKTVLICSGSGASYEQYTVPMVDALMRMGHHVMVFNYRGFGESEGSPSEHGFNLDTEAAYQYLKRVEGRSDDKMAVLGYSLGADLATGLAIRYPIPLIIDRYFLSMKDVACDKGWYIAKAIFYLGGADFNVKRKISAVQGKILLANASHDETMRPYHRTYLEEALRGNPRAQFIQVQSTHIHHFDSQLWFHPHNSANSDSRARLQSFLVDI